MWFPYQAAVREARKALDIKDIKQVKCSGSVLGEKLRKMVGPNDSY